MPIAAAIRRRSVTGEHQSFSVAVDKSPCLCRSASGPAGAAALPREGRMSVNDDAWTQPRIAAQ
jgi:hypothetical protein